jgi:hypothetical protein
LAVGATFPRRETARPDVSDGLADGLAALRLSLRNAVDADWPFLQALFASFRAEEMAHIPWPQAQKDAFLAEQFRLQHHHFVTYFCAADFWIVERSHRSGPSSPVGRAIWTAQHRYGA